MKNADLKKGQFKVQAKTDGIDPSVYEGEVDFTYSYYFDLANFINPLDELKVSLPQGKTKLNKKCLKTMCVNM